MTPEEQASSEDAAMVVATSGSPSTNTELTLDLAETATESRLIGGLVGLSWNQYDARPNSREANPSSSNAPNTAVLGQITSIEMRNRWHEDQTFKNIVKSRGELPAITKLQDTRTATMKVGGCFVKSGKTNYSHADLGSVPDTGVNVNLVRQTFLDEVLASCADDLFYLGHDYAGNIRFPMWFKHFGSGDGGVGEAYHTGIFGKTGSGKTGLAKMLLAAYARHPAMGMLVIDPQGEFTLGATGAEPGSQYLRLDNLIENRMGRRILTLDLSSVQLEDLTLFEELMLESGILQTDLGIRGAFNLPAAVEVTMEWAASDNLPRLRSRRVAKDFLEHLKSHADRIYKTSPSDETLVGKINRLKSSQAFNRFYANKWEPIAALFSYDDSKTPASDVVRQLTLHNDQPKPIVILNLAGAGGSAHLDEAIQRRIISHIANAIVEGSATTLGTTDTANTLVVLDEAHRFAPSGRSEEISDEARLLRSELRRAVRETRKYGVGWMFISQTMMGLDTELLMQLRTMFFGYGLAFGLEFMRLRELAGGDEDAMSLYRSFRDPQSAMDADSKRFPFMAIGPISPMPFSGQPMFFSAFNGTDFTEANKDAFTQAAKSPQNRAADNAASQNSAGSRDDGATATASHDASEATARAEG